MAGTTLGTAYVQIIPSAKGIGGAIRQSLDGEAGSAGQSAGLKISSGIKKALGGLAIGATITAGIKAAVSEGGKLEQSYGGLDTIYGKASKAAKAYAQDAAAAGISANDYAEQAVSFGASLKKAFEGDTTKAVEAANTAILDMTDNAAKMGTPIESIQMAYQGFAKQNYTMLDNLKIGYGGTKTEMEKLLKDASELSGVEYNIDNLGDVYDAIHVIQGDLGLTGVAADEAATTFEGSFNAMKAAASNLLGNLALGENIESSVKVLATNVSNFLFGNMIPMIGTVFKSLPTAISTFVSQGLPQLKTAGTNLINGLMQGAQTLLPSLPIMLITALQNITTLFSTYTPQLIAMGSELLGRLGEGLTTAVPTFLSNALPIISGFTESLRTNAGTLIDVGLQFITNIAQGLINSLPTLITYIPGIVTNIAGIINDNVPKLIATGLNIIVNLAKGIVSAIPTLVANIPQILQAIVSVWTAFNWLDLGIKATTFIKDGIVSLKTSVPEALKNIGEQAKEWFSLINWKSLGSDVIDLIVIGVQSLASAVPTAIKTMGTAAINLFKSIPWASVGRSVLSLLAGGVSSAGGAIRSAVSKIANSVKTSIKTGFDAAKSSAVKAFEGLKTGITSKIEAARDKVRGVVNAIKGFFPLRIGNIFSGMKLPHFSVSGSPPFGIGGKGTKPSISVSWYKKAQDNPYLFSNATLFGAGEAGDEVLYGRRALMRDISSAVNDVGSSKNKTFTINNYVTVDGAERPEDFVDRMFRRIELQARTV